RARMMAVEPTAAPMLRSSHGPSGGVGVAWDSGLASGASGSGAVPLLGAPDWAAAAAEAVRRSRGRITAAPASCTQRDCVEQPIRGMDLCSFQRPPYRLRKPLLSSRITRISDERIELPGKPEPRICSVRPLMSLAPFPLQVLTLHCRKRSIA